MKEVRVREKGVIKSQDTIERREKEKQNIVMQISMLQMENDDDTSKLTMFNRLREENLVKKDNIEEEK
ncbi:hypothetical protein RCL_jg1474.t1 [Rhizophagus clarus]|uniref:Uncharacterized protein n=1 Tax=Rhizophagus clarus TaxID=94130 RepID=A0A8H3QJ22_9GLOM|nr:hypothetical protein RCL_jg1474.t1 [Rhizophagus clarus]